MRKYKDTPYYVTEDGDVYSNFNGEFRKLKPSINKQGYYVFNIRYNNKSKTVFLHRIIGECFINNLENKKCINHIDGNKLNNKIFNLEWVTHSENNKHAFQIGLKKGFALSGLKHYKSKLTGEQIKWIRDNYKPYDKEFGRIALSKKFNISKTAIRNIINNKSYKDI